MAKDKDAIIIVQYRKYKNFVVKLLNTIKFMIKSFLIEHNDGSHSYTCTIDILSIYFI